MNLVLFAISIGAAGLLGFVGSMLLGSSNRKSLRLITGRVAELEEDQRSHLSTDRIISAMEKNPFIAAYDAAMREYKTDKANYERQLQRRKEYDRETEILGCRNLAAEVISAFPMDYKEKKNGVPLSKILEEFEKYHDSRDKSKRPSARAQILKLITKGYIVKFQHSWVEEEWTQIRGCHDVAKTETRYKLSKYKEKIISLILVNEPEIPEKPIKPNVKDFINVEDAKQWVDEARVQLLEEELARIT